MAGTTTVLVQRRAYAVLSTNEGAHARMTQPLHIPELYGIRQGNGANLLEKFASILLTTKYNTVSLSAISDLCLLYADSTQYSVRKVLVQYFLYLSATCTIPVLYEYRCVQYKYITLLGMYSYGYK